MAISRRDFIQRAALSGIAAAGIISGANKTVSAMSASEEYATIIDLTKCDGCIDSDTPKCVLACRTKNRHKFPQPEKPIQDYWPQPIHEDWSDKQEITDRLTPYNWTYVQTIEVEHNGQKSKMHIPRRCMHCDHPACSALCPFGVNEKMPQGPVLINTSGCFGGAKCRDVCPWHIPQRQAGVGLYKKVAPKFAGGGVMYKCDICYDLIIEGKQPACVSSCPNQAIRFGSRKEIDAFALDWAKNHQGYLYGHQENGGTSTFYLSKVPFEKIHQRLLEQEVDGKPGRPALPVNIENSLNQPANMAEGFLIAPLAGLLAAGLTVYKTMKGDETHENPEA